ncbi:hypothetical protein F5Y05DRAFT_346586 [Hypoxylon sp. FL0543]|nr:hypothetical protein F5Y05DRAFT_346586 [Hypoxylon sp. FL0543]
MIPAAPKSCQDGTPTRPETKFRFFGLLPPEIRREIYLLATPARVVFVDEDGYGSEEWHRKLDDFRETCQTTPVQFKLHPDIAYFAHNWCPRIWSSLRSQTQRTLDDYGFSTTARRHQPWVPTEDVPEIPSAWLTENPDHAWDMTRSASLSSRAPIPAFLHVCTESRQMLQAYGYRLSFATRTHGPRTWFHFGRDTLYITNHAWSDPSLLSGGEWDVGLFRPADLLRVERLALRGVQLLALEPRNIADLLRLIPNLKDLFFVSWGIEDFPCRLSSANWDPVQLTEPRDHCVCLALDEADIIPSVAASNINYDEATYHLLKDFKEEDTAQNHLPYFDYFALQLKQAIYNELREAISEKPELTPCRWNVPRMQIALVCPREMADDFFARRRRFWNRFLDTKSRLARGRKSKLKAAKEQIQTPSEFQDVGEAYLRAHEPDECERWEFHLAHHAIYDHWYREDFTLPITREELWWLTKAVVCPPRYDIL